MSDDQEYTGVAAKKRKPRLALMGEFSAGKSTLTNLLLGTNPLPVRVTATRLPPVWISYGEESAIREDLQGNAHPLDIGDLESVPLQETRLIRLTLKEDILELCDLIDMPGISDPNMASEMWDPVLAQADHIVWCTHATQAWRQSEAAVWDAMPQEMHQKSILLLTRFDKILSAPDRERLLARVRRETQGMFSDLFPISLTEAVDAGDDRVAWENSGAEAFGQRLIGMLMDPAQPAHGTYEPESGKIGVTPDADATMPVSDAAQDLVQKTAQNSTQNSAQETAQNSAPRVQPRRVHANSAGEAGLMARKRKPPRPQVVAP